MKAPMTTYWRICQRTQQDQQQHEAMSENAGQDAYNVMSVCAAMTSVGPHITYTRLLLMKGRPSVDGYRDIA